MGKSGVVPEVSEQGIVERFALGFQGIQLRNAHFCRDLDVFLPEKP